MVAIYLIYLALHQRQVNLESCNMHLFYLYFFQSSVKMEQYVVLNNTDQIANSPDSSQCSTSKSWKEFWTEKTNLQWPANCRVRLCGRSAVHGAHIKISGRTEMYIIPMCASCNSSYNKDWMNPNQGTRAAIVYPGDTNGPPNCNSNVNILQLYSYFSAASFV